MKLLLTSHGRFCEGLRESYEMIAGKSEYIDTCSLTDLGVHDFRIKLYEKIDRILENDSVLILCDIKGGTPYNESFKYALEHVGRVGVVTGMNLPMLIELGVSISTIESLEELIDLAIQSALTSIESADLNVEDNEDDDLF